MNEKRGEKVSKIEVSQAESETQQDEEKTHEEDSIAEEKPIERMTKKELVQKVKVLQERAEKDHDLYLRSQAEIDNIIKRNKKEKEEWVKYSNDTLIKEILPVMDNLENAISHSQNENSLHALREGVELTLNGLRDTLMKSGLEEVKTEGEPFDPNFHHAVSEQDDESVEAGMILHELQKGYTINKRLIRPAMVVLSKGRPGAENSNDKAPKECVRDK